ncbi:pitrilysin family protein [Zobellia galactanivorans]|uniref:Metallopeptidase, family M16 n=1 Tax=Zobellia galactanivorans (strain DSM 12802 / CCUG 47099 / CIP 106680 / NCIMB 13871 / Dsij) TaxID=63186 RepID=G0L3R6_ZOBGA|nr:pitrilysin family protein [Zobellia galactanivorans]MBU3028106.1 insulinase family protein [Zobellia galactanivorans]MDO6808387.1 pitrilysin family protein [Zobellia galactanivorans]CAZ95417.1 Metallopeptidase, family M16 [Zobellia galactanivorans]
MKKKLLIGGFLLLIGLCLQAQEVKYEEYDLDNGLHVILHQDNSAPLVTTSVMYHVGGKDRTEGRTGFAHFFEHLLFEGTKNIERGKWFEIVSSHGGINNANTSQDRTYYYEVFPSNNLKLGLWLESERMLHPVIDQKGVETQQEVVKEEKRLRYDNRPYGQLISEVGKNLFKKHPYKDPNIGYMEDLDAATLDDVIAYNHKYYVPNNAVLVVAGDIDLAETKKMIQDYFGPIPKGKDVVRNYPKEDPILKEVRTKAYDPNIQLPASVISYRTPGFKERDAYVLDMISTYLSDGRSSKLYKKMVDEQKQAIQVGAFNVGQEDYGMYLVYALPVGETDLETLITEMEEEVAKVRDSLISEKDHQKLLNKFENQFVNSNSGVEGIAHSLAQYYLLYGDTELINKEIDIFRSITREEIMEVANKYLRPDQRVIIDYLPKEPQSN